MQLIISEALKHAVSACKLSAEPVFSVACNFGVMIKKKLLAVKCSLNCHFTKEINVLNFFFYPQQLLFEVTSGCVHKPFRA